MSVPFEPQQFGRYFLVDKVAVGGMAEVFKARIFSEGGFQKLLVIKRILGHLSGNDEFVDMFIDEAKISVELQHPNIVQVYDFGKLYDNYYIAMECIEGKDVRGILKRLAEQRLVLPVELAACIAHEMCKGLDFAHKKHGLAGEHLGIIHRDVSPSNILVSYDGDVKVADFGIAKAQISLYNTKDGVLKGKFEYMSPEQASGENITPSSDIFACGIILHEMLTGRRLFKTDSEMKTLKKVKAVDVPLPSEINSAVPPQMDAIVMRALARDPADRFEDCRAFQQALAEFLLPQSADLIRESLGAFMQQLFAAERSTERERLQSGSAAAVAIWEQATEIDLEEEWSEEPGSGRTLQTQTSKAPLVLALLAVLVAAGAALFVGLQTPETRFIEIEKTVTTGDLHLKIEPDSADVSVFVRDQAVATGSGTVLVKEIEPGADLPLRVEAVGHETWSETIDLIAGERLYLPVRLKPRVVPRAPAPVATTAPPPQQAAAPGPPTIAMARFRSSPTGAEVYINGRSVGRTPVSWQRGTPGESVTVEYRLAGHDTASFKVEVPAAGGDETFNRSLKAVAAIPGSISVNVKSGWATVWIDGKEVDTTPLVAHQLPAGTYTVKVVNPQSGIDQTQTVTITSGKKTKVLF